MQQNSLLFHGDGKVIKDLLFASQKNGSQGQTVLNYCPKCSGMRILMFVTKEVMSRIF